MLLHSSVPLSALAAMRLSHNNFVGAEQAPRWPSVLSEDESDELRQEALQRKVPVKKEAPIFEDNGKKYFSVTAEWFAAAAMGLWFPNKDSGEGAELHGSVAAVWFANAVIGLFPDKGSNESAKLNISVTAIRSANEAMGFFLPSEDCKKDADELRV